MSRMRACMHVAHGVRAQARSAADFGARDGAEISRGEIDIDIDISANINAEARREFWKNARQAVGIDAAGGLLGGTTDATVGLY